MSVHKTVCEKISNILLGFLVESRLWQPRAFNRVSLSLSCSAPQPCDSLQLSYLISVVFLWNETTSDTHHRRSYNLRNPNIRNTGMLFLAVSCPQSVNDPWIKGRKQRTQKASDEFFFLCKVSRWKQRNKQMNGLFVCRVSVWDGLWKLLWLTHFSYLRLRWG